jgi:anti-anti-sigma factor
MPRRGNRRKSSRQLAGGLLSNIAMITHQLNPDTKTLVIAFAEDLLSTNVDQYRKLIFDLLNEAPPTWEILELDFSRIKRMDSLGLNLIVGILTEVKNRNAKMTAFVPEGPIRQTLLFTRMGDYYHYSPRCFNFF